MSPSLSSLLSMNSGLLHRKIQIFKFPNSALGWRPRRTIKFCSWGAEESGLIGSTEWVEENERALSTKGVTYINVDIAVGGNDTMFINGSPLLKTIALQETKKVQDPHVKNGTSQTMYERMVEWSKSESPDYGSLGSGSDYASFYQFAGKLRH